VINEKEETSQSALWIQFAQPKFIAIAFGGGTNSTAMLVGMYERGIKPDLLLFADTGGEKPHTYQHITQVNNWLFSIGWPQIITVKKVDLHGDAMTLEQLCLNKKMLPSLAYGFKSCSLKFKVAPQDKFCNNHEPCKAVWKLDNKVVKYIGYDVHEERRVNRGREIEHKDKKYTYEYPLFDWGWDRDDCIAAIKRVGLSQPGKSACFFCPASKIKEIRQLNENYPELANRALAMEANAELISVKGLGRRFAWSEVLSQIDMFNGFDRDWEMPCDCFDGDEAA